MQLSKHSGSIERRPKRPDLDLARLGDFGRHWTDPPVANPAPSFAAF